MPDMVGLPGTKRKLQATFIRKVSELPAVMRSGKCATAAGGSGAINAWIDDAGQKRCETYKNLRTIEAHIFRRFSEVKKWYAKWLKHIQ